MKVLRIVALALCLNSIFAAASSLDSGINVLDGAGSSLTPDQNGDYTSKELFLELDESKSGLLRLQADTSEGSELRIQATNGIYWATEIFEVKESDAGFKYYELSVPFAPTSISIRYTVGKPWLYPDTIKLRDLEFKTDTEVHIKPSGSGTVTVLYTDPDSKGNRTAYLYAFPSAGWSFIKWEGSIRSDQQNFSLPINKWEYSTAHFAKTFETDEAVWHFTRANQANIELLPEAEAGPLFRITPIGPVASLGILVEPKSQGTFKVNTTHRSTSGETLKLTNSVGDSSLVPQVPFRLSGDLFLVAGEVYTIESVEHPQIELITIDAPDGVVSISPPAPHNIGDTITASIIEAFREHFAGWRGTRNSTAQTIEITLTKPEHLTPIFSRNLDTQDYGLRAIGGRLWSSEEQEDGSLRLSLNSFAPGEWADIETDFHGPLTIKIRALKTDYPFISFTQADSVLARSLDDEEEPGFVIIYVELANDTEAALKIGSLNETDSPVDLTFDILGLYQKAVSPYQNDPQVGTVGRDPLLEYYPVNSKVTLTAQPFDGFEFLRWSNFPTANSTFEYTVKVDEPLTIDPVFGMAFESSNARLLPSNATSWQVDSEQRWNSRSYLQPGEFQTLALEVEGPGLLQFQLPTDSQTQLPKNDVEVLVDGLPATTPPNPISNFSGAFDILFESGTHQVEIILTRPEGIGSADQLEIDSLSYHEGFLVAALHPAGLGFKVSPHQESQVHPANSRITIKADDVLGASFKEWAGDLAASTAQTSLTIDRHLFISPIFQPPTSIGLATISPQSNINASVTSDAEGLMSDLLIYPIPGKTSLDITIPPNTELSFIFDNLDTFAVIEMDGDLLYEGLNANGLPIALPVSPNEQTIRIKAYFTSESAVPIQLTSLQTLQLFWLGGDFGERSEHVAADPDKDHYQPGEQVDIYLKDSAPKDWGFYDLVTSNPNLGVIQWEPEEDVRIYTIEIKSDTIVNGRVGPPIQRAAKEMITGEYLQISDAPTSSPSSGPAKAIQFVIEEGDFFRVFVGSANHVQFNAKLQEGQFLFLPPYDGPGSESVFAGDGEWHAFSLPVPLQDDYLNFFAYRTIWNNIPFYISDLTLNQNYGASYITSGPGSVTMTSTNSPSGNVTLQAKVDEGAEFISWGSLSSNLNETIETPHRITAPSYIDFQNIVEPNSVELDGERYFSEGTLPTLEASSTYQPDGNALAFKRGDSIHIPFEKTEPHVLHLIGKIETFAKLKVEADGIEIASFEGTFGENYESFRVQIPSGAQTLRIHGPTRRYSATTHIFSIELQPGYFVDRIQPEYGEITFKPNKSVFLPGEIFQAFSNPNNGYKFIGWTHNIDGDRDPKSITANSSLQIGARFAEAFPDNSPLPWDIHQYINGNTVSATLTLNLNGPGTIHLLGLPTNDSAIVTLDGKRISSKQEILIPQTARVLKMEIPNNDFMDTFVSTFIPGYRAILSGNTDLILVSPERETYQAGEKVTLDWKRGFSQPTDKNLIINGTVFEQSLPIEFTITDHLKINASLVDETHHSGYYSSGDSVTYQTSAYTKGWLDSANVTLSSSSRKEILFGREFTEGGILSYTPQARNSYPIFELTVDGTPLPHFEFRKLASIRIPSSGARIEWRGLIDSHIGGDTTFTLSDISFVPDTATTPFKKFMSDRLPSFEYAIALKIEESDDFDGDGFSNQFEFEKQSDPAVYTIPVSIHSSDQDCFAIFDLSQNLDTNEVALQRFNIDTGLWQSFPLTTLQYQSVASPEKRIEYTVDLDQLGETSALVRVAVTISE